MGASLAKSAEAVRAPILKARSSSRLSFRRGQSGTDSDDDETFQDLTGKRRFESLYLLDKKLGAGTYAEVYRCTHRKTRKERAVKIVMLDRLTHEDDLRALEEEIEILSTLRHKNIVRLYHVFREEGRVYLVQEICAGGELFDRIVAKRNYCENDARELMRRALQALAYAHGEGVVHRDLKPENILLSSPHDDVELKLADFGMARALGPNLDSLQTICGSPGYMAPEIITQQPYDEKVDIWSLGTILFCLLGGYNPWDDRSTAMVFAKIKRGKYRFDGAAFQSVTEDAKDLIKHMLVAAPAKRISAIAALHHRWFTVNEQKLMQHDLSLAQSELKEMRKNARFRRAANAVLVANRLKVLSSGRSLSGSISASSSHSGHDGGGGSDSGRGSSLLGGSASQSQSQRGQSGSVSLSSSSSGGGESKQQQQLPEEEDSSSGRGRSTTGGDGGGMGVAGRGPSAAGSGASRVSAPSMPTPPGTRQAGAGKTVSFGGYGDRKEEKEEGEDGLDKRRHPAGVGDVDGTGEELKVDTDTWM